MATTGRQGKAANRSPLRPRGSPYSKQAHSHPPHPFIRGHPVHLAHNVHPVHRVHSDHHTHIFTTFHAKMDLPATTGLAQSVD
jgi:hypothetical protein